MLFQKSCNSHLLLTERFIMQEWILSLSVLFYFFRNYFHKNVLIPFRTIKSFILNIISTDSNGLHMNKTLNQKLCLSGRFTKIVDFILKDLFFNILVCLFHFTTHAKCNYNSNNL